MIRSILHMLVQLPDGTNAVYEIDIIYELDPDVIY